MGGFFGAVSRRDCVLDVFFGVDYHSHLGTRRGGMIIHDREEQRRKSLIQEKKLTDVEIKKSIQCYKRGSQI